MNGTPGGMVARATTIEQVPGPAALLQPAPWRLTPNTALDDLIARNEQDEASMCRAFESADGKLTELLARGRPFHGRLRFRLPHQPGSARLLHVDFAPQEGHADWLCSLVDLTPIESRHSRRALTLERLQDTLNELPEHISMLKEDETLLYTNASWARFYGVSTSETVGRQVIDMMGPENHARTLPYRRQLFSTLQPVRYERALISSEGVSRVMGILLWPIQEGQGHPARMATLARDVTLRHQGMEALHQTLERLDALFEAGIEGIVLCEQGVITDANPVACRHIGQAREVLVGQPLASALELLGVPPSGGLLDDDGTPNLYLSLRPGHNGTPPLQIQAIAFMDDGHRCHAVLLQDMSYRQQAQRRIDRLVVDLRQQTARAEAADRSKSVFLASASHDLRQPIHSLGLFLTTIQSMSRSPQPLNSEPLRPIVQRMRASLDALMQLLDMLLGASLRDAGQRPLARSATPLQPLFDELVTEFAPLASGKGLMLRTVPSRAWVMADPTVLRRILRNLVSNAVRYTRQGRIVVGARTRGEQLELQVWDTGVGIDDQQLEAIFQAFYRVDLRQAHGERAEGLGLSIVKRAAAELDARLDVRSILGRGSVFSVTLPRAQGTSASAPEPPGLPRPDSADSTTSKLVLLIDDDEQVLHATAQLLESWGHRVLSATSAVEATQLCESQPRPIDAVICDYMLDPAMDGLDLLLRLRQQHAGRLPVCLVTGDMSAQCIGLAQRHGFVLLHKPVGAAALQRFLQTGEG